MGGEKQALHLIGRHLELLRLLGHRLVVGVEVSLALRESEHRHQAGPQGVDPRSSPATFLPCHRVVGVAVGAVDRVDPDLCQSVADLDDFVAAFLLPGYRPALSSQVCWNACWRILGRFPGSIRFP